MACITDQVATNERHRFKEFTMVCFLDNEFYDKGSVYGSPSLVSKAMF